MMHLVDEIKTLLDQGDYLKAATLADENKITDCREICNHLDDIRDIGNSIEHSVSVVVSLEEKIAGYESELRNVKDIALQMEEREHAVEIQSKNLSDTCALINELISNLIISEHDQRILLYEPLNDDSSMRQFVAALERLELVLRFEPDPNLLKMRCLRTQKEHAFNIRSKFCDRFYQQFTSHLEFLFTRYSEALINKIYNHQFHLPEHDVIHKPIYYMAPLVHWVARNDKSTFKALHNYYVSRSKTQYDKEIKIFFECARERLSDSHSADTIDTVSGRSTETSDWYEFDGNVERILQAIDPVCESEQNFYGHLFTSSNVTTDESSIETHKTEDSDRSRTNSVKPDEITTKILIDIFMSLETELIEFSNHYGQQNGLYSLYLIVRLSQYLKTSPKQGLFLNQVYPEILIKVKRTFDNFMELQLNSIREAKPPKGSKCGVLHAVKNFEQFAKQVESLFKYTGARTDIDRWYRELISELFRLIDRLEHSKTPTEMIWLENYYYLHDVLRSLKVPCLEAQRKEANLQYKAALNAYVSRYFGRPLEKVNVFFEGVHAKLAQGVKEEEISFQVAFNKQELRKVLQMVTLKEVKKGLEDMYRRIEKHAYEPDSNLIQVIWHAMQDEFLSQYKSIQGLIERCYPATNLSLPFTIDDILKVFSDIAQSH